MLIIYLLTLVSLLRLVSHHWSGEILHCYFLTFFVHNFCDDDLRISSQALSLNDNRQCRILLIIQDTDHMV